MEVNSLSKTEVERLETTMTTLDIADHPIKQSPVDILLCIFEEAISMDTSPLMVAIKISHVNSRWRRIAVDTSWMWAEIELGMDRTPSVIVDFWSWIGPRIKDAPAKITIGKLGTYNVPVLRYCPFDTITHIHRLAFEFTASESIKEIFDGSFKAPKGRLDELHIAFLTDLSGAATVDSWSWETLLDIFPQARDLYLQSISIMGPSTSKVYPNLRSLTLVAMRPVHIEPLTISFPNLELLGIRFGETSDFDVSLSFPHLIKLTLLHQPPNTGSWIRNLGCPSLTELLVDTNVPMEDTLAFLTPHPSVKELNVIHLTETVNISKTTPNAEIITVSGLSESFYRSNPSSSPQFPLLKILALYDVLQWLTGDVFDEIVRTRCLPAQHPESQLLPSPKPLEVLSIILPPGQSFEGSDWIISELFKQAPRISRAVAANHALIELSWVDWD